MPKILHTLNFSNISTKISFFSFFYFLDNGFPAVLFYYGLILVIGLVTALEGAVCLLKIFHLDLTLSLTFVLTWTGYMTIGSLTVYCLMFSVAINYGCP